jgi:hypothetical protein
MHTVKREHPTADVEYPKSGKDAAGQTNLLFLEKIADALGDVRDGAAGVFFETFG